MQEEIEQLSFKNIVNPPEIGRIDRIALKRQLDKANQYGSGVVCVLDTTSAFDNSIKFIRELLHLDEELTAFPQTNMHIFLIQQHVIHWCLIHEIIGIMLNHVGIQPLSC